MPKPASNIIEFPAPQQPRKRPKNTTSDGRRCIRLDIGTDPETGKRRRKAFYGATLKEARAKADEYKQMIENGIDIAARVQPVSQWLETYIATYRSNCASSTRRTIKCYAAHVERELGAMRICDVKSVHVQRLADSVSGMTAISVNHIKSIVCGLFDTAIANDMILRNPCTGVVWRSVPNRTHRALTDAETAAIAAHWRERPIGGAVMVMLYTGLRIGEAAALQWEDVDLDAGVIHVRHGLQQGEHGGLHMAATKTRSSVRDIPIIGELAGVIRELPRDNAPYLFRKYSGISGYQDNLKKFCQIVGFDFRFHDLRHTFATNCYRANVDIKTAQKLLGHSSPQMTLNVYTHLSQERERASLGALETLIDTISQGDTPKP